MLNIQHMWTHSSLDSCHSCLKTCIYFKPVPVFICTPLSFIPVFLSSFLLILEPHGYSAFNYFKTDWTCEVKAPVWPHHFHQLFKLVQLQLLTIFLSIICSHLYMFWNFFWLILLVRGALVLLCCHLSRFSYFISNISLKGRRTVNTAFKKK